MTWEHKLPTCNTHINRTHTHTQYSAMSGAKSARNFDIWLEFCDFCNISECYLSLRRFLLCYLMIWTQAAEMETLTLNNDFDLCCWFNCQWKYFCFSWCDDYCSVYHHEMSHKHWGHCYSHKVKCVNVPFKSQRNLQGMCVCTYFVGHRRLFSVLLMVQQ